jgi:hydrogenase/urease accessory protein HupE
MRMFRGRPRARRLTLRGMRNRASVWNLLLSLMAFVAFMVILLTALGFGVGTVELMIWLVAIVLGVFLIVRRYRSANAATQVGAKDRR